MPDSVTASTPAAPRALEHVPLRRRDGAPIVRPATVHTTVAIAEAVFSRNGEPPAQDRLAWVGREIEDFLARCGAESRFFFSLMVWVTSVLAPLFIGRMPGLVRLSLRDRVRALATLERRFGEPLLAVKAMLCLVYYEHPDAAAAVGFDGQCLLPRSTPARTER
jgi:hypothetical protein